MVSVVSVEFWLGAGRVGKKAPCYGGKWLLHACLSVAVVKIADFMGSARADPDRVSLFRG